MNHNVTIIIVLLGALALVGCPAPGPQVVKASPIRKEPAVVNLSRPPRAGPLTPPAYPPTSTPVFWPTGMPAPTRWPEAAQWMSPSDKAICLQRGGFWDQQRCMRGPDAAQTCWEVPTTDAERPCSDSSECQGWCDPNLTWNEAWALAQGQPADPGPLMTGTCSRVARRHDMTTLELREGKIIAISLGCE